MSSAEEKTAALLAKLWVKIQPIVEERLMVLDTAVAAADSGTWNEDLRKEAQSSAHKLAGSLGMYGFDEGTRVARQLDQMLASGSTDPAALRSLVSELRAAIVPRA